MVSFVCACGETIRKPKVRNHLQQRHCEYLSCVDCNETFYGEDYSTHNKCISEAEKYMGKLYKPGTASTEGSKQDRWQASVMEVLENYQGPLRGYVDTLVGYDNIPRKEKAFNNFIKNSLKLHNPSEIRKLWELVQSAAPATPEGASKKRSAEEEAWGGWVEEIDRALKRRRTAEKSMPWKQLRDEVVTRYLKKAGKAGSKREDMNDVMLSKIPKAYLSKSANKVSLPSDKQ
ncbi:hypothetical protein FOL47_006113 [Perkinsus chesapeaki]|uniref:Zinc finger C2H2 LYAR-type domain-containing protein n=2 Tax=Alveolata TaxID=33630 RepID=A0A7J6MXY6_PERCH|nr:hypothetical protein FOL47_006113 [Perkinsus chesapeaki]